MFRWIHRMDQPLLVLQVKPRLWYILDEEGFLCWNKNYNRCNCGPKKVPATWNITTTKIVITIVCAVQANGQSSWASGECSETWLKFTQSQIIGSCVAYDLKKQNTRNWIRLWFSVFSRWWSLSNPFLYYRSGTVNSKSFVGKVLLRIKWKFKLTYAL